MAREWTSTASATTLLEKVRNDEGSALQILLNPDLQPVAVNQAVRSFIAIDRTPVWSDLIADSDLARWENEIRNAVTSRCSLSDCFRLRRFDNAVCPFVLRAEPKFATDGKYAGHLVSGLDISDLTSSQDSDAEAPPVIDGRVAAMWHDQLVSVSTVIKGCTDHLPNVLPEKPEPDLAAIVVRLQSAANSLRDHVLELSSTSRATSKR